MKLTKSDRVLLLLLALALGSFALYSATRPDRYASSPESLSSDQNDTIFEASTDTLTTPEGKGLRAHKKGFLTTDRYPGPPQWMTERKASVKLSKGQTLDLNTADTLDLVKVPGIGPSFSRRIWKDRCMLGGFYAKEQLQEVYGMDRERYEGIAPYFTVGSAPRSIFLSPDSIGRHPYLSFRQRDALLRLIQKGDSLTWPLLMKSGSFTRDDSLRLSPYLPIR